MTGSRRDRSHSWQPLRKRCVARGAGKSARSRFCFTPERPAVSGRSDSPQLSGCSSANSADQAARGQRRAGRRRAQPQKPVRDFVPADSDPRSRARPAARRSQPTFFIDVLGDSLAVFAAGGLTEAFADKPEIAVVRHAHDASGLVRDDYYDWPKAARDLADRQGPASTLSSIDARHQRYAGAQDGADTLDPLSDQWRDALRRSASSAGRARSAPRTYPGRLGRPAADAHRTVQRADRQAQRNLQGASRKGRRANISTSGTPSPTRAANSTPTAPTSTARTPSCARPTASISPRPARARSRNSSRPTSAGVRRGPSRRTTSPTCRPTSNRRPTTSTRRSGARWASPAEPGAAGGGHRTDEAARRPDPVADRPAASPGGALATRADRRAPGETDVVERVLRQGAPADAEPGRADDFSWPRL